MRAVHLVVLVALATPATLGAQVGHDPRHSPYRDVLKGHTISAVVGAFGGSGGSIEVGPHHGASYGARFDVRVSNPVQFAFTAARAELERVIQDPDAAPGERLRGTVPQNVYLFDVAAQFNLTGSKSWHRLMPYVGAGLGVAVGQKTRADTTRFNFGGKITLTPMVGARLFVSQTIRLRAEARAVFWRLSYPSSFGGSAVTSEDIALLPDGRDNEWVITPWVSLGLGVSF